MKLYQSSALSSFAFLLSIFLTACGASIESNTEDIAVELENLLEILEDIDDRGSAKDSIEDIEAIADNIKELRKERDDLIDEMSKSELRDLEDLFEDDYEDRFKDAFEDIDKEENRIRGESWGDKVLEATYDVGVQLFKTNFKGDDN